MDDQNGKAGTSLSILEKFRQLSKEKEKERCGTKEPSVKSVGAVYLKNPENLDGSSSNNKRRWNQNRRDGHRGDHFQGKRKFDGEHSSPPEWKMKRKLERDRIGQHVGLKAADVGITEYISAHTAGFNGIIKQRFSDFQVNEISFTGKVVKLTSQVIPKLTTENENKVTLENDEDLLKILPKQYWDNLYSIVDEEDPNGMVKIEVTDWPKERRIQVHSAIKNLFKDKVISNTIEQDDKKILQIVYSKDGGYRAHNRSMWNNKEYLHFVLHKENMDTTEVTNLLAHKLQKPKNCFHFCGTKDKRAMTSQKFCVKRVMAERLNKLQPLRCVTLGNYAYKRLPLRLGSLKGNRFRVVVRNIDATEETMAELLESLETKGFINYYGMQRFGVSVIVPTHAIGLAFLHKDWQKAVELILKPRPGERCYPEVSEARKIWWETKDAKKASKCFSWKSTCLEAKVLQGLHVNGPTGYLNALENLPRNMLMFYIHAYQSLIWNKIVSRRIKEFGFTPLPGDIVLCNEDDGEVHNENKTITSDKVELDEISDDDDNGKGEANDNEEDSTKVPVDEDTLGSSRNNIKFLTEDEAKDANIENIVYPLPGYEISYPKNIIAEWYNELLKEDGLSQDSFLEIKRYSHIFSGTGAYRKMIAKPGNLLWSVIKYSEENADLLLSDIDEMNGVKPIESVPDGKYRALIIKFDLVSCSYATMALREIMKCETSSSFQASLSAQHVPQKTEVEENSTESSSKQLDTNGEKILSKETELPSDTKTINCNKNSVNEIVKMEVDEKD